MVRKKIDNRIRVLIEKGVESGHRTMLVVVGDKGRDQVMILHHMLTKASVRARPNLLWCYKKELGFNTNRQRRMKSVQRKIKAGKLSLNEDDPFELFIASTEIRYCYYNETHKILGCTYGMLVLQDFEAFTPNLLARTVETVEGGGLVVLLLHSLTSLKQLYTMTMDVHDRFRTEAHSDVQGRFNERFILSLSSCDRCLVVDDNLTVLPISSHVLEVTSSTSESTSTKFDVELKELQNKLSDTQPISCLINLCKTLDQGKALLKFIDVISEKTLTSTVSLTASRGRGKSAALGLSVAAAVAFGYANIFVTSPSPENLKTFFEFVFKGFEALNYQEHLDYNSVKSTEAEFNKAVVRINVFRENRQTIQYIQPTEWNKLSQAELLVVDEAAAIPLPLVKNMLGPYLVFLSSTINGYEGTGRSLSLKLLAQLRKEDKTVGSRVLHELSLEESIRYRPGDSVESWLTSLLCLDANNTQVITTGVPPPSECDLYYINRDTLFCYHKASEAFLHQLVSLYVSSHYKNSPNDLQMMSDAPAHHLFCLLGPVDPGQKVLPQVLCVVQVCLEGELSKSSVAQGLSRARRAAGDLIPWTIAQQFQDKEFPSLAGARIVRIATHPDYSGMGYGSRALALLKAYYQHQIPNLDEQSQVNVPEQGLELNTDLYSERIEPRKCTAPLLLKLTERAPEQLDYLGVSYGLTLPLLKFWKRAGFVPVYLRQTANDLTGEYSCIMLCTLGEEGKVEPSWLAHYWADFSRRFIALLSYQFRALPASLALSMLRNQQLHIPPEPLTKAQLDLHLTKYDLKRIEMYCNNLVDYHLIMDLLPTLAKLFFLNKLSDIKLLAIQELILIGLGLQHKSVDELSQELELPATQLMALYNRLLRKLYNSLIKILEDTLVESLGFNKATPTLPPEPNPTQETLAEELHSASQQLHKLQKHHRQQLLRDQQQGSEFAVKGSDEDWALALAQSQGRPLVSVKAGEKHPLPQHSFDALLQLNNNNKKKKKKHHKH